MHAPARTTRESIPAGERHRFLLSLFVMVVQPPDVAHHITRNSACHADFQGCPMSFWMTRASQLGALIETHTHRDVAIDAYTHCMPEGERESRSGVTVRVHGSFPAQLEATQLLQSPWTYLWVTLMKWVAVSLDDAEFVIMLDLDMDILTPSHLARGGAVVREWLGVLASMRSTGVHIAANADHSAPINAGFMLIRPNRSLYEEGVELLGREKVAWNVTHGWEFVGRPQDAVPLVDVMADPSNEETTTNWLRKFNLWNFVGANIDQGFMFHMYRVRHSWPYGMDLCCLPRKGGLKNVSYSFIHMFNKPHKSSLCSGGSRGNNDHGNKHKLIKSLSYYETVAMVLAGEEATDQALVPNSTLAHCRGRAASESECARGALEKLKLKRGDQRLLVKRPLESTYTLNWAFRSCLETHRGRKARCPALSPTPPPPGPAA
mmetsp:Transcript_43016/g.106117  ORF Transcript_43016/g.106117 Transcript_43016/m.106117 type:complete len:434 (-) Transcript_43016:51-1352(-)